MKNVLMLDLEGVLIASSIYYHFGEERRKKYNISGPNIYRMGIRPHAQYFLDTILPWFDFKYMNTCCDEGETLDILKNVFGKKDIHYYPWRGSKTKHYKTNTFANCRIIHIEDEGYGNKECIECIEAGHHYIPIKPSFLPHQTHPDSYDHEFFRTDTVLLDAIEMIRKILGK